MGMRGIPSNRKEGGEEPMKLLNAVIKMLHYVTVAGTWAAIFEIVLTAIYRWLSH